MNFRMTVDGIELSALHDTYTGDVTIAMQTGGSLGSVSTDPSIAAPRIDPGNLKLILDFIAALLAIFAKR